MDMAELSRRANFYGEYDVNAQDDWSILQAGDTITITTQTAISLRYELEDGCFITCPMPQAATEPPFGKRFQGWTDVSTGTTYQPGRTYEIMCDRGASKLFEASWLDVSGSYGKNLYLKVNGTMKQGTAYVKVNNTYTPAVAVFVKVDGRWKTKES
jgi:hypothetical protein